MAKDLVLKKVEMQYLHTMIRVRDLDESLEFFCNKLGMQEVRRKENEKGRFTLVFLAASQDVASAKADNRPTLELTYNWPDASGNVEHYASGCNFGHLAYVVDHIYDYCQDLMDKGIIINRPPRDGYMAFIKSPDGISIEILQKDAALDIIEPWQSMENIGDW